MIKKITEKHSHISIEAWVERLPNELEVDLIFMQSIIPAIRENFGLEGDELTGFVRKCLHAIFDQGGQLVVADTASREWRELAESKGDNEDLVEKIIETWCKLDAEPDWFSLWFEKA